MKKSLLVTLEFPPDIGGISTYYSNLCDHLPPDKIVVLTEERSEAEAVDRKKIYPVIRKQLLSKKMLRLPKWARMITEIQKAVDQYGVEKILVGQILPIGTAVAIIHKKRKIPFYVFCHGMDLKILRGRKKILAKKILHASEKIFVNSCFTKHLVENFGIPEKRIVVVYPCPHPLPTPTDLVVIELKNRFHLHDKKILLTVGRIVERKGHDAVIQALPQVLKHFPDCLYVIVGDGPFKKNLQYLIKKIGVEQHTVFTNSLNQEELSAMYEMCDIFIMTPRELKNGDIEGFGIVYLEANLFGKPVIATKTGGVTEAVIHNQTGLVVSSNSSDDIAQAIIQLLSNQPLTHRLGMQGMDRVHHTFEWSLQAKKIKHALR